MAKISVICIIKNQHPRLFEVLKSVKEIASEIIIADTGISEELEKELLMIDKLKIVRVKKKFSFAELIREDLKHYAKEQYILFVDHDEIIPPDLKKFILDNYEKYDYFAIPRKNIVFNKWIKHSRWFPDYQIRLINKDKVYWDRDIDIHKQPELKGKGLFIEAKENLSLIHYNYENIDEYISKAIFYAKQESAQLIRKNKVMTLTQTIQNSISEFISRFFAEQGYKDGTHGFALAILQMFYYFLVYFYYWESKKYIQGNDNLPVISRSFFRKGLIETNYWLSKESLVHSITAVKLKIENKLL